MKSKNLSFSLKTVSEKVVETAIKGLKMKRSAGADSLTQEQLKLGSKKLIKPLTKIINQSIEEVHLLRLCTLFSSFLMFSH